MDPIAGEVEVDLDVPDADCLDCAAVNLAAVLRYRGCDDVRPVFGSEWRFEIELDESLPEPALARTSIGELLETRAGFSLVGIEPVASSEEWTAKVQARGPLVGVGDAYLLPWHPHRGRVHVDHLFVIEGGSGGSISVADAFADRYDWGVAVPTRCSITEHDLTAILGSGYEWNGGSLFALEPTSAKPRFDELAHLRNEAADALDRETVRLFVERHRSHPDGVAAWTAFATSCGRAAQARRLNARWLADVSQRHPAVGLATGSAALDAAARAWTQAATFASLALWRVRHGRAAPQAAFDLVGAADAHERDAAERLTAALAREAVTQEAPARGS